MSPAVQLRAVPSARPERQVIIRRGSYTRAAAVAMARAVLESRPPRARRVCWRLARSWFVVFQGAAALFALAERELSRVGVPDRSAAVRAALAGLTSAHQALLSHPREGRSALALVTILAGESMECMESVADDGSWSRATARFALATLDAMRP